jgi:hypothetical protein
LTFHTKFSFLYFIILSCANGFRQTGADKETVKIWLPILDLLNGEPTKKNGESTVFGAGSKNLPVIIIPVSYQYMPCVTKWFVGRLSATAKT